MIKFRAWDKRSKEMGSVQLVDFERREISNGGDIADFSDIELMQSTGLKDLKDVDIFEGDVVWIIDKGEMDNGWGWFEEVKFRNGSFMVGDDFLINSHHRCVVRGNIYE